MQMATFKAATTTGTSVYADLAYAPYGETYAASGASDVSFTGQNNDRVSNLYDFLFREYHPVQGRWISPDPAGMAAVDPMNPESWNRYAYVGNSPLTATDANGLVTLPGCEEGDFGCGGGLDPGCGMWGGPEGDICTLLLPVIGRWGGGGGGSGSGGSGGGGGTDNGGSTGSGGGTSGSSGSGGRIANFPNEENLGLPPGVSGNWGGILGAVLPIDPSCEFGTCLPGVENFSPVGAVAGTVVCQLAEPCGVLEDVVVVGTGLAIAGIEAWQIYKLAKGGTQNVGHDYVRDEARQLARDLGISYCEALQKIYQAARAAGNSKKANDTKATQKQDGCRGH
jgi:RHS repeat-associated protein